MLKNWKTPEQLSELGLSKNKLIQGSGKRNGPIIITGMFDSYLF